MTENEPTKFIIEMEKVIKTVAISCEYTCRELEVAVAKLLATNGLPVCNNKTKEEKTNEQ